MSETSRWTERQVHSPLSVWSWSSLCIRSRLSLRGTKKKHESFQQNQKQCFDSWARQRTSVWTHYVFLSHLRCWPGARLRSAAGRPAQSWAIWNTEMHGKDNPFNYKVLDIILVYMLDHQMHCNKRNWNSVNNKVHIKPLQCVWIFKLGQSLEASSCLIWQRYHGRETGEVFMKLPTQKLSQAEFLKKVDKKIKKFNN